MSLNYEGIGFAFEAEDKDLRSVMSRTRKGLQGLRDMLPSIGSAFESVHAKVMKLGDAVSTVESVSSSIQSMTTGALNLTTSLEAEIAANSKEIKRLGTNYGFTGKKFKDFSKESMGLTMGLRIGTEQAAQAVRGWHWAHEELSMVGIKSMKDLAKFTDVSGVSAEALTGQLKTMTTEFGFSSEEVQSVVGSFFNLGVEMEDVGALLNEMPKVIQLMRDRASRKVRPVLFVQRTHRFGLEESKTSSSRNR